MYQFVTSIRAAVKSQNWFGALFMALAIPDICAALEDGQTNGKKYKFWFDRYLKAKYSPDPDPMSDEEIERELSDRAFLLADMALTSTPEDIALMKQPLDAHPLGNGRLPGTELTAEDCYAFRCKSLHQGLSEGRGGRKIDFSVPGLGLRMHQCSFNGIYVICVDAFCEDMCLAVEQWLVDKAGDSTVQQRISELISFDGSFLVAQR